MIDSIWRRAYDAWQKSGLTRRAFHQTHISTFFPEQPPCIWTLYKKFQQIERLIEAEAVSRIQNAGTVAVVELPAAPADRLLDVHVAVLRGNLLFEEFRKLDLWILFSCSQDEDVYCSSHRALFEQPQLFSIGS